jgi:hypothetical protein
MSKPWKILLISAGAVCALIGFYAWNSWPTWYPERYRG